MFKRLGLAAIAAASIACGKTGEVKFELAIANNNDRTADVKIDNATGVFTMANVIVIVDKVVLKGDGEAVVIDTPTPFRFDAEKDVAFLAEVAEGNYTSIEITIGIADAATAALAGEENIQDRSFHLEGDLDTVGIVTYAPAAQTVTFNAAINVENGKVVIPEVEIDLQKLVEGVDYALAENVDNELALTEDNATDQTPIISANVAAAWSLIVE
jgi:hypothetical protein